MRLTCQPNLWTCTPTSFAMVFGTPLKQVLESIGHDGSKIEWPDEPEPKCRRGFHPQELVRLAHDLGYSATPIELFPVLNNISVVQEDYWADTWSYFYSIIQNNTGVIEGQGHRCRHCVAYCNGYIYDPMGEIYPYSREACESRDFYTQCAWIVERGKYAV